MDCERCGKKIEGVTTFEDKLCDDCLNDMLMPGGGTAFDWGNWDFEKGDYKM